MEDEGSNVMFSLTSTGREAVARGEQQVKVFVYWNLHRKVWSVKALSGYARGLVIGHGHAVWLRDVTGKVSAAGRDRVRREGVKHVHAGMVGTLDLGRPVKLLHAWFLEAEQVTYNPYKHDTFVFVGTGCKPFTAASECVLDKLGGGRPTVRVYRSSVPTSGI
jgi:hypothetical protein